MNELLRRILCLPPQASSMAREIDQLHYSIILVTMAGATLVAASAAWFGVRYRSRAPLAAPPADEVTLHPPRWFEASLIAMLLTLFVGWWVIGFRQFVRLEVPPPDTLDIHVIAKQWMWSFAYPDGTASNAVLYVPVGKPIKLILGSRDVIHSFYVPAFRIKQDAVPGQSTTAWFQVDRPGTYPVFCAEYCGTEHSQMRAEVVALPAEELARKLERLAPLDMARPGGLAGGESTSVSPAATTLARAGERIAAERGCLRCHTIDGAPHIGPTWARLYESDIPLEGGAHVAADEAYLTESMMDPRAKVHQGFPAIMPPYRGLLDVTEVAALVELIRSLRDVSASAPTAPLAPAKVENPILPRENREAPRDVRKQAEP